MKRKGKSRKIQIPTLELAAEIDAGSVSEDERTFEVAFYTGAEVVRYPYFDEPYLLSMRMRDDSVRWDRINAGAPVTDGHWTGDTRNIVGVTSNGRIEGKKAKATVRFSQRAEVADLLQDIRDGIVKNVSMGVNFFELEEIGTDEDTGMPRIRANDWEPNHIAILGVGADPGAQIELAADKPHLQHECIVFRAEAAADAPKGENTMKIKVRLLADTDDGKKGEIVKISESDFSAEVHEKLEGATPPADPAGSETPPTGRAAKPSAEVMKAQIDESLASDKQYQAEIRRIASHYGCDDLWAQKQINLGVSVEDALAAATTERAKMAPTQSNDIGFGEDHDAPQAKVERMADALALRAMGKPPTDEARDYYNASFAEIAFECLAIRGRARRLDLRRDRARILSAELALHTTSDFPLVLANVMNKLLLPAYEQATPTYRQIAVQRDFRDFRPHNHLKLGDFPNLLKVNEHGEFKYGTIGENNEPVTAATYGRILGLSRQTLINDDLMAFNDLASMAGQRVTDFENTLFYVTVILAGSGLGPQLSDGVAVYDAGHSNVTGPGALDNTRLAEARALMRKQESMDGLKLNIQPAILLVSPDSETQADTLVATLTPAQASQVNPFAGRLEVLADANLTGTRFYVLARMGPNSNYMYGFVDGSGPRNEVRSGFEVDGVEFKIAIDFGVGATDYRGGVTGAGA